MVAGQIVRQTVLVMLALAGSADGGKFKFNVLYLIADDLRPEFMGPYGQTKMVTPSIDRLAQTALVFENAYANEAVCGPSRASFMTGRRPSHTMVYGNDGNFRLSGRDRGGPGSTWITMPEHFKRAGWLTLGGGKTFHPELPRNWDQPRSWSQDMPYFPFAYWINPKRNKSHPFYAGQPCPGIGQPQPPNPPPGTDGACLQSDTWCAVDEPDEHFYDATLTTNTIERLRYAARVRSRTGQPFALFSGYARPHAPWRVPKRFWDLYQDDEVSLPAHPYPPEDMPGIAWFSQGFYNATDGEVFMPTPTRPVNAHATREMRHAYQAAVSWLDHNVGLVLAELDALGMTSETCVVFHGDHGFQLGEHNSWHKYTNFELGTRVPLLISAPWLPASVGKRTLCFAELVDVYPTLAALAGTGPPHDALDGTSLLPVFSDPRTTTVASPGTLNKSVAWQQFPHSDFYHCRFYRGGACHSNATPGGPAVGARENRGDELDGFQPPGQDACATRLSVAQSGDQSTPPPPPPPPQVFMGHALRDRAWRYVVWVPWSQNTSAMWNSSCIFHELYDHRDDDGTRFGQMDIVNRAYDDAPAVTAVVRDLFSKTRTFFEDIVPPVPPPVAP